MNFQNNFTTIRNTNVSTFVEDGVLYLSLSGEVTLFDKNKPVEVNIVFPKINISKVSFEKNTRYKPVYDYATGGTISQPGVYDTDATITFKVLANKSGELFSAKINEPEPKEMSVEEIEKELGYKIKVKQ